MNTAQDVLGVTFASAQNNVKRLVKLGILREVMGRKRDRIFIAPEMLQLTGASDASECLLLLFRQIDGNQSTLQRI